MLTIQGLSYRYGRRGTPVLNGVDLTLARGEIGILLGRNGSGKTTLFRNILGLCTPDSGSIRLDGLEMTSLSPRRRARYIACVPQDICFGALTVFDSVLLGRLSRFGLQAGAADHAAASQVLEELGLSALSPGIMRRVDSLGRFVLPKELRRQLQIECNDYLQIYTEGEKIIIQKAQCSCALCGRTDDLIDFNDKKVCKSCVGLIKDYL